jgi:hypothetical protein
MDAHAEVPHWRKSTRSSSGNCVEVRADPVLIRLRDSKDPEGGMLSVSRETFADFLDGVRRNEFDLP